MTPHDLELIGRGAAGIDPDPFATTFYDTLFDLAPAARGLFPDDLADQRAKLMAEITTMISLAMSASAGDMQRFVERTHRLGARHVAYGATPDHYAIVGQALIAALGEHVPNWSSADETAWTRLYGVIASTMLEGAELAAS